VGSASIPVHRYDGGEARNENVNADYSPCAQGTKGARVREDSALRGRTVAWGRIECGHDGFRNTYKKSAHCFEKA